VSERKTFPWRGALAIAATYVAFLLFAQFGFLAQLQRDLGDAGRVRMAMAAMGIAGLAASLGTAWLLGRIPGVRLIRMGLGGVAAVAILSLACHGLPGLMATAAGIGASLGLLTVAVAASLPEIVPPEWTGRAAGVATGTAYSLSNMPALFEGSPAARALFPAALAVVALIFAPRSVDAGPRPRPQENLFVSILITFLVLIWLDSAAFAIVQGSPELKALTWGGPARQLVQGSVHAAAAIAAGVLLDLGFGISVPLAAWGLFAVAFPLLQHGGAAAGWAGPLYAAGISLYSTALVVMPSRGARPSPRWRAGLLYGIAGWLGSALGVGMAQDQGRIPGWFLLATGAALALAWVRPSGEALRKAAHLYGPALGLGAAGVLGIWIQAEPAEEGGAAAVARGRRVYVEEGCIHCHSQYVRPGSRDEDLWGPYRPLDRSARPPLIGVRRQGPDLLNVGARRSARWHEVHLRDPRALTSESRMPSYAHLFAGDGRRGRDLVAYLSSLGAGAAPRPAVTRAASPLPRGDVARGAALFASTCATCHGPSGGGDGPAAKALGDPYVDLRRHGFRALRGSSEPLDQGLARIIRHGLPPTPMPSHEWLGDQQVADLVAFVKTLAK